MFRITPYEAIDNLLDNARPDVDCRARRLTAATILIQTAVRTSMRRLLKNERRLSINPGLIHKEVGKAFVIVDGTDLQTIKSVLDYNDRSNETILNIVNEAIGQENLDRLDLYTAIARLSTMSVVIKSFRS